jgi:hypothetical protein
MFVYQARRLAMFHYNAEAVETANVPRVGITGKKHYLDLNPRLSALVEELILNIKMRFLHHPRPRAINPWKSVKRTVSH